MTLYVCDDPVLPSVGVTSGESGQVRAVARLRSGAEDRGDTLTQAGAHIVWVLGTLTQPHHIEDPADSCQLNINTFLVFSVGCRILSITKIKNLSVGH